MQYIDYCSIGVSWGYHYREPYITCHIESCGIQRFPALILTLTKLYLHVQSCAGPALAIYCAVLFMHRETESAMGERGKKVHTTAHRSHTQRVNDVMGSGLVLNEFWEIFRQPPRTTSCNKSHNIQWGPELLQHCRVLAQFCRHRLLNT